MGGWLVGQFTVFSVPAQNWMPVALAIVLVGIVFRGGQTARSITDAGCSRGLGPIRLH
jgi:hypothetical protein